MKELEEKTEELQKQAAVAAPVKKKNKFKIFAVLLATVCVCCLAALALVGLTLSWRLYQTGELTPLGRPAPAAPAQAPYVGMALQEKPTDSGPARSDGGLTTEEIVKKAAPSVVSIQINFSVLGEEVEGVGSGMVLDKAGNILTNAHVVENAKDIFVTLYQDKKKYAAKLVGKDRRTDLAVICLEEPPAGLLPAEFGDAAQSQVGERIVVIGASQKMEYAGSVAQGIISGLERSLTAGSTFYEGLIQIDAAVNPGNSGGALMNRYGQIIGINTAKMVDVTAEGMGFAISVNNARPIVKELMEKGSIQSRVCLGFTVYEVNEEMARVGRIPMGLCVQEVLPQENTKRTDVLVGDVITALDGKTAKTLQDVKTALQGKKAAERIELTINRYDTDKNKDKTLHVTVTLQQDLEKPSNMEELLELFKDEKWKQEEKPAPAPKSEKVAKLPQTRNI